MLILYVMYAVYLHHTDQSTGNCGRKHRIREQEERKKESMLPEVHW